MKVSPILIVLFLLSSVALTACHRINAGEKEASHEEHHKIVVTSPLAKDVVITQQYVCQIHSQRNIEVCALQDGYLEEIPVKEGQAVKQGDVLFKVIPTLYKARLDAEVAEAKLAQIEFVNTKKLFEYPRPVVSDQEVALAQAKLDKANAKAKLAAAEVEFTIIRAPFDGIVDRLQRQHGSLVERKDVLTTLSDNHKMWVYFNVPESRYLEYMAGQPRTKSKDDQRIVLPDTRIELRLADGSMFHAPADDHITIEGKFNNETGNIPFRADFPNPDRLLRHGQTGTILINRSLHNTVVIPQRATFEILDKRYVYVVGEDHVVQQRLITIEHELEDVYVLKAGLTVNDKIVLEGVRQVHEGQTLETGHDGFKYLTPEEALENQKNHAE